MHQCICDRKFREAKHLRQHEQKCQAVKEHDQKLFATISGQSASTSSNKRHHELVDHEADDSDRFMGGARRKKQLRKGDGRLEAGPSSGDALDVGLIHSEVTVRMSNSYLTKYQSCS